MPTLVGAILVKRVINVGGGSEAIIVSPAVVNMAEEGETVGQMASQLDFKPIILVTSSYHMHRIWFI